MKIFKKISGSVFGIVVIGGITLILGVGVGFVPKLFVAEKDAEVSGLPSFLATAIGEKAYGMPIETFTLPEGELRKPEVGEPAPDFTLPSTQGGEVGLTGFKGKTVILDFTTTWCGMTWAEHDNFTQIQEKYGDTVVFLTIDAYSYDTIEDLIVYQRKQKREWIFALDEGLEVAKEYGVRQTVSTFVIDKEGIIRYSDNWITGFDELDSVLTKVI